MSITVNALVALVASCRVPGTVSGWKVPNLDFVASSYGLAVIMRGRVITPTYQLRARDQRPPQVASRFLSHEISGKSILVADPQRFSQLGDTFLAANSTSS